MFNVRFTTELRTRGSGCIKLSWLLCAISPIIFVVAARSVRFISSSSSHPSITFLFMCNCQTHEATTVSRQIYSRVKQQVSWIYDRLFLLYANSICISLEMTKLFMSFLQIILSFLTLYVWQTRQLLIMHETLDCLLHSKGFSSRKSFR